MTNQKPDKSYMELVECAAGHQRSIRRQAKTKVNAPYWCGECRKTVEPMVYNLPGDNPTPTKPDTTLRDEIGAVIKFNAKHLSMFTDDMTNVMVDRHELVDQILDLLAKRLPATKSKQGLTHVELLSSVHGYNECLSEVRAIIEGSKDD